MNIRLELERIETELIRLESIREYLNDIELAEQVKKGPIFPWIDKELDAVKKKTPGPKCRYTVGEIRIVKKLHKQKVTYKEIEKQTGIKAGSIAWLLKK